MKFLFVAKLAQTHASEYILLAEDLPEAIQILIPLVLKRVADDVDSGECLESLNIKVDISHGELEVNWISPNHVNYTDLYIIEKSRNNFYEIEGVN